MLAHRERVAPVNRMLTERLDVLLPGLMRETGVDLWLVLNREYAEDPVFFTLVPDPVFAARRTTMLVFHDRGPEEGVDRLTVNRYPFGDPYESAWEGGDLEAQWAALGELIAERDPRRIGVNVSRHWPVADGLTAALRDRLMEVLSPELRLSGDERRGPRRALDGDASAERACDLPAHRLPGARRDLRGVLEPRHHAGGHDDARTSSGTSGSASTTCSSPPGSSPASTASVGAKSASKTRRSAATSGVIAPGDVLHTDVGVCYLRLCTDTQEMGYVAALGEARRAGGAARGAGRRQSLAGPSHRAPSSSAARATRSSPRRSRSARPRGSSPATYTHPLGFFGHAPGPTIGMWDNQGATPVRGDWPLHESTVFSIEGNVKAPVPSWGGQLVQIKLEQDAVFDGRAVTYLAGRQTRWHLVQ